MREVFTDMIPGEIKEDYLNGIYFEIANLLGIEAAKKMHTAYRGQQINFPVNFYTSQFTANKIADEFDGKNIKHLASKYGYSEKWIRKILKERGLK